MAMLIVIFRNFANAPKNQTLNTYVPHCMTEYLVIDQSNTPKLNKIKNGKIQFTASPYIQTLNLYNIIHKT